MNQEKIIHLQIHLMLSSADFMQGRPRKSRSNLCKMGARALLNTQRFLKNKRGPRAAEIWPCPRSRCYAPLKNASGDASVQTVRAALQESDRHTYFHLTGKEPPSRPFELDQAFYYPTDTLRTHWQGKPLPPSDYIDT